MLRLSRALLPASTAVFAGCSDPADDPAKDPHATGAPEDGTGDGDNRFEGVNYDGREFRIYTSTNIANAAMGNSNFLINTPESDCVFDFDRPYRYRDLIEEFTNNIAGS